MKYRLNLTVAHQYVFQMEEMVQHAIFGNVGTMVVFRVGGEDAELLEKEFMPEFTQQDLVNLGFKQIYTKLMIDGITSRPFSAETLAPFPRPAESHRDAIIAASRTRYGTPRAVVEDNIRSFTMGIAATAIGVAAAPEGGRTAFGSTLSVSTRPGAAGLNLPQSGQAPARSDRPMYEAVCAVDGKKILVPFKPDGSRPVYCEEHMDMIKFRSKGTSPGDQPALRRQAPREQGSLGRPAGGEARAPRPVERSIPLHALRPGNQRENNSRPPAPRPAPLPEKKEANLSELRRALEESLRPDAKPLTAELPSSPGEPQENTPKVLAPGETIRFE